MLWIQPSWYGYKERVCIKKYRTYTVYDDEKGTCEQIKGAELVEMAERRPAGALIANAWHTTRGRIIVSAVGSIVEPEEEPDVPMVKFNLNDGKTQQSGEVNFKTEFFPNGNVIRIGDKYCIDWKSSGLFNDWWEFCGGYLAGSSSGKEGLGLALWDIHRDQNFLRGYIRLTDLSWMVFPNEFFYPFALNLETGLIDFGEWGRTKLLATNLVMRRRVLGEPARIDSEKYEIKRGSKLSNDYPCDIVYEGLSYKSAEAAYQSTKTKNKGKRKAFCNASPDEARKMGVGLQSTPYVKKGFFAADMVKIMEDVLYSKFTNNKECRDELLGTGERHFIAGNIRGFDEEKFVFIRVLTRIRSELMSSSIEIV